MAKPFQSKFDKFNFHCHVSQNSLTATANRKPHSDRPAHKMPQFFYIFWTPIFHAGLSSALQIQVIVTVRIRFFSAIVFYFEFCFSNFRRFRHHSTPRSTTPPQPPSLAKPPRCHDAYRHSILNDHPAFDDIVSVLVHIQVIICAICFVSSVLK